jgi:transcriptional regulator with XRE-family HTH domain
MKRTHSTMTAAELEAWRNRHSLTKEAAAAKLGISERMIYRYEGGQPISETVALLCHARDEIRFLQQQFIKTDYE